MGNHLEVNSDAVNFPLEESVHNGYLEFKNVDFACPTVMKGRLRENISFWQNIGASRWVLHVLQEGYSLPFISHPQKAFFRNLILVQLKIMFLFALRLQSYCCLAL